MLSCFCHDTDNAITITPIVVETFQQWLTTRPARIKNWLNTLSFQPEKNSIALLPNEHGELSEVLIGLRHAKDFWAFGALPDLLIEGSYKINADSLSQSTSHLAHLAWGLGCYQFATYKKFPDIHAQLVLSDVHKEIEHTVRAVYLVRDLINTPTEDMGPAELAEAAAKLAEKFGAEIKQIIGDQLLAQNFPAIYTVGKASDHQPRLIDLTWGDPSHPTVTLVGKGVCFDSGGLNIKSARGMLTMKKDMGGAAHVLGLAYLIMATQLPVRLRVLIPAVENVIAGSAYHPGDIIVTRKGLSVEVTNTDAEGRLILCDALAYACEEPTDLLIDMATLTGAARVALGPDIAVLMTNCEEIGQDVDRVSQEMLDPVWQLPLYQAYREYLESSIADLRNASLNGYAGAITAGLYLQSFVSANIPWAHFDIMAWNEQDRPGRQIGGEAHALRTLYHYLKNWHAN